MKEAPSPHVILSSLKELSRDAIFAHVRIVLNCPHRVYSADYMLSLAEELRRRGLFETESEVLKVAGSRLL